MVVPMPPPFDLPRPIAFALSGGVAHGAIQVGQMQALMAVGIRPDLLVGTSAGALNASFVGQGWTPAQLDRLAAYWRGARFSDFFGYFPVAGTLRLLFGGQALVSNSRLRASIARELPATHAELAIPTTLIATDLRTGHAVALSDGDLRENALASTALPGVFPPVERNGVSLVDGGVAENVPALQASLLGAQTIVVLDSSQRCELGSLPRGVIKRTILVITHTLASQTQGILSRVPEDRTVLLLPGPCPLGVAPGDFSQAEQLMSKGRIAADRFLAGLHVRGPGMYHDPLE
jgi:NTE family protein